MNFKGHKIGLVVCKVCWNDSSMSCKCGGRIHREFGDEGPDGWSYDLEYLCDKCGKTGRMGGWDNEEDIDDEPI